MQIPCLFVNIYETVLDGVRDDSQFKSKRELFITFRYIFYIIRIFPIVHFFCCCGSIRFVVFILRNHLNSCETSIGRLFGRLSSVVSLCFHILPDNERRRTHVLQKYNKNLSKKHTK